MAWEQSTRRQRLPKNWAQIRRQVLHRDRHLCQILLEDVGTICGELATEVDHVVAGDNHALTNLQAICTWHHRRKSSAEGAAARPKFESRLRKQEAHPSAR